MLDPADENTTAIDLELIASELERTAKLAGNLKQPDLATEIGALASRTRQKAKEADGK